MTTVTIMKKKKIRKPGQEYSGWEFSAGNSPGGSLMGANFLDGSFLIPYLVPPLL